MINRLLFSEIKNRLISSQKIVILYGARQVGKTTLVQEIIKDLGLKSLSINADEQKYNAVFSERDLNKMLLLVEGYELLFIDEAQRIIDIGINLKILHDAKPNLKIIVTGSSSFELANKTKEALTGRTWTYTLFPISVSELRQQQNLFEINDLLEQILLFGMYPDVINLPNQQDKIRFLNELTTAYLYKDVFELATIKYPEKLKKLLQLLAFQAGSEVSLNEIANSLDINRATVESYIDLLEKAFVIFRLSAFSRNLRKEINKMDKIYFYDLGVRNALINNFNSIDIRNDNGALWENFLVVERLKNNNYQNRFAQSYFWRTYTGAELDYIEERNGQLQGFEFKFSKKVNKAPKSWQENYVDASFECINRSNYWDFIL
jgi:predicted AAA+ superfamily ATPase